jgi:hypothetical protein
MYCSSGCCLQGFSGTSYTAGYVNIFNLSSRYPLLNVPQSLLSFASFVLHSTSADPSTSVKPTFIFGLLQLHVSFFLSGLIHMGGEFIILGHYSSGFLLFFVLQGWGITAEIVVRYSVIGPTRKADRPTLLWRLAGHAWVLCWFTATLPLAHGLVNEAGLFHGVPGLDINSECLFHLYHLCGYLPAARQSSERARGLANTRSVFRAKMCDIFPWFST